MGGGNVKKSNLKNSELVDFHNMSSLSNEILISLHKHFAYFSSSLNDDGVIDYEEFCQMLGKTDNLLCRRIFNAIDLNKDKKINFREFLKFFSCFMTGTYEEQISLSFKVFCKDDMKFIDKTLILNILKECILNEDKFLQEFFDSESIIEIVEESFAESDTGLLNLDTYKEIIELNPSILEWFKVDMNKLRNLRKNNTTGCFGG
jgi:Ca2+-binding EF-hand superfamily protein